MFREAGITAEKIILKETKSAPLPERATENLRINNLPKVNIIGLIASISSILSFFIIITYYLEKLFAGKRKSRCIPGRLNP